MDYELTAIGTFLEERKTRFKPEEARRSNLPRVSKIDFSGQYHLVQKDTNTDMILVKEGDLLISGINAEKGAVTIFREKQDALATIHYSAYSFNKSKIDIEYFRWFLKSETFTSLLKSATGSGIKKELRAKHLLPLKIFLPTLENQKLIVKKLESIIPKFHLLTNEIEKQRDYLSKLSQAILEEIVQGKLVPQEPNNEPASQLLRKIKAEKEMLSTEGKLKKEKPLPPVASEEIPFELPKDWVWCRLGEIVNLISGVTLGKAYSGKLQSVPYLRVANVQRSHLDLKKIKEIDIPASDAEKYSLKHGDLLMVEGGDWDKVGRCAIWRNEINPCIHQNHIFRLRFYGGIIVEWAELFLNSPVSRRYFESCSKQTTNLASINQTQLKSALFPLPPISAQFKCVEKLKSIETLRASLETNISQSAREAEQLLQSVLYNAFNKSYQMEADLTMAAEPI